MAVTSTGTAIASTGVLSSLGVGSNLDVNGIITKLMTAESQPLIGLATKEASYQTKLSAYGSLNGALSSFQSAAQAISSADKFVVQRASVGDALVFSAFAGTAAAAGNYSVQVNLLAQAQKLYSGPQLTSSATVGSGTLSIEFGNYSGDNFALNPDKATKTVTIGAGQSSLAGIRDAINGANVGVQAGIVNDGSGYRLTLTSNDTGAANAMRVSVADGDGNNTDTAGLSKFAFDGRTSGVKNMTQSAAAQNASLTIDGINISKASNTVTDAVEGVTLNLLKQSATGTSTSLTVARDGAGIQSAIQGFITAYNSTAKTLSDLSAYNVKTKTAAALQGDSAVLSIQSSLRNILNSPLSNAGGGFTTLSDIGVSLQTDGTMALDNTKFQAAINDPTKDISTLFAAVGKPSDSLTQFVSATSSTKAGNYALNVTQLATQAVATGDLVLGSTTITAGVNDTLSFKLDGNAATITLKEGSFSATELAAEIQSKINGVSTLANAGSKVNVSLSGGALLMTSSRYGSGSVVSNMEGTALASTFGTVDFTNATGKDVAGTLGGVAATGAGQLLSGTGDATGMALKITGGATGDRGTVKFAQGYAAQLDHLVGSMIGTSGMIASRTDGINSSIKDIGNQRSAMNLRLAAVEARYRAQYTALDLLMSKMSTTSSYLQQQLANLPGSTNSTK
jgi:flagellar hook-associated protein 2